MARRRFGIFGRASDEEAPDAGDAPPPSEPDEPDEAAPADDPFPAPGAGTDPGAEVPTEAWDAFGSGEESDTAERVRLAAESAADEARGETTDELRALESDLERARDTAAERLEVVESRLPAAERRATAAEQRAEVAERALASERESAEGGAGAVSRSPLELEDEARAGVANWLREQLAILNQQADERLARAVEAAEHAAAERAGSGAPGGGAAEAGETAARLRSELDAERELLARAETELEALRGQLERARAEAISARTDAMRAAGDAERAAREELESRVSERTAELRTELEAVRGGAAGGGGAADAGELEHLRAELRRAEDELARARADRARAIESAERRLREIEQQAVEAADLIAAAEVELKLEGRRLRAAREQAGGEPASDDG